MHFLHLLNSGQTPEAAAGAFVLELTRLSSSLGHLSYSETAYFVTDLLKSIGFDCKIIAENLVSDKQSISLPPNWVAYVFKYNPQLFAPVEKFLESLSTGFHKEHHSHETLLKKSINSELSIGSEEQYEKPIDWFMQLLAAWCCISRQLMSVDETENVMRFSEPLAHIDYHLLVGLAELRRQHREEYPLLDPICNRLYQNVLKEIFYAPAHETIVMGLLKILEDDFDLFYNCSTKVLQIYYVALSAYKQKEILCKVFKSLTRVLNNYCPDMVGPSKDTDSISDEYLAFTDFLIAKPMLILMNNVMRLERSKYLLNLIVEYFATLEKKVASVDEFSRAFIEYFLEFIFLKDKKLSLAAAKLFYTYMSRKTDNDKLILFYLIEFYITTKKSNFTLPYFVNVFWRCFPHLKEIQSFFDIIHINKNSVIVRSVTGHMLATVYTRMLFELDRYEKEVKNTLTYLPTVLTDSQCQRTSGVLLKIMQATNLDTLIDQGVVTAQDLLPFSEFALRIFMGTNDVNNSFIINMFTQLVACLKASNNLQLLTCRGLSMKREYSKIERSLRKSEDQKKVPQLNLMAEYKCMLFKLHVILRSGIRMFDFIPQLTEQLIMRLLEKKLVEKYILKFDTYLDVTVMDTLTSSLMWLLSDINLSAEDRKIYVERAKRFGNYLKGFFANLDHFCHVSFLRIKPIFCNLCILYNMFNAIVPPEDYIFKINAGTYNAMVQILVIMNFDAKTFVFIDDQGLCNIHIDRMREYQSLMFMAFGQMHNYRKFVMPSNVAWKLCINYGLPPYKYTDALCWILRCISVNHLKNYKHIIAIIIFNLHKRTPELKDANIERAIKAHCLFIDRELPPTGLNTTIVKVDIILTVLEIVQKSISVVKPDQTKNRLESLRHLPLLLVHIRTNANTMLGNIIKICTNLENSLLTSNEHTEVKNFVSAVEGCYK